MAYGIRIESGNGSLQIDSDTTNVGLIVIDKISSSSSITYDTSKDLIFARPASGGGSVSVGLSINSNTGSITRTFRTPNGNNTLTNMEIIKARFAKQTTAATSGYGLQIFNADGDLAFDSEGYNGDAGLNITHYFPRGSEDGRGLVTDPLTTDGRKFALFNHTSINSANAGLHQGYTFTDSGTNDGIAFFNYINIEFEFGTISDFFQNWTPLLLGEGGSV
jgi:hypothetical protein